MIRINEFMERKGIKNQTELAKMLGLTQSAISSWNSGVRAPTHEMCEALLKMGMTLRELFGDEFPDISVEDLAGRPHGRTVSENPNDRAFDEKVEGSVLRLLARLHKPK